MRKTFVLVAFTGALLFPSSGWGQAAPLSPLGSVWITPHIGLGFQGEYHDAIVQFGDGDLELLRLDPGSGIVFGVQAGYRVAPSVTLQANLGYSKPDADYVEDTNIRPSVGVKTTQVEAGILYDLSTFPVAGKVAPFLVGGGLSLTFHSFDPFQWSGTVIQQSSTSIGVHGLAALDIPLAPKLSFRGQVKLTAMSLSLGDLNSRIAAAEGDPIVNPLDGGINTYIVLSGGITIRL